MQCGLKLDFDGFVTVRNEYRIKRYLHTCLYISDPYKQSVVIDCIRFFPKIYRSRPSICQCLIGTNISLENTHRDLHDLL